MNSTLDWRALLAGSACNAAVGLLLSFGSGYLFGLVDSGLFPILAITLRAISALADIGGGALAGYLAGRQGTLHGALTSLIATLAIFPISMLRMALAGRDILPTLGSADFWIDFGLWTVVGLFLAAAAGFLAAELRKSPA